MSTIWLIGSIGMFNKWIWMRTGEQSDAIEMHHHRHEMQTSNESKPKQICGDNLRKFAGVKLYPPLKVAQQTSYFQATTKAKYLPRIPSHSGATNWATFRKTYSMCCWRNLDIDTRGRELEIDRWVIEEARVEKCSTIGEYLQQTPELPNSSEWCPFHSSSSMIPIRCHLSWIAFGRM